MFGVCWLLVCCCVLVMLFVFCCCAVSLRFAVVCRTSLAVVCAVDACCLRFAGCWLFWRCVAQRWLNMLIVC